MKTIGIEALQELKQIIELLDIQHRAISEKPLTDQGIIMRDMISFMQRMAIRLRDYGECLREGVQRINLVHTNYCNALNARCNRDHCHRRVRVAENEERAARC